MENLQIIAERIVDIDEIINGLNKIPCQSFSIESILYNDFGIKVRDDNNEYRRLYDVLEDVSKIYTTLGDNAKDNLRKIIMGSHCSKERFESYLKVKVIEDKMDVL